MNFVRFDAPYSPPAWIPADVELRVPENHELDAHLLHFLVFIPWQDEYVQRVPRAYRRFFTAVLPYLCARSTDVHVATCLPYLAPLIADYGEPVIERAAYVAFILHDSGWSQMSDAEIAASLGVSGLALSGDAVQPKLRHVELGADIARRVLGAYSFDPPLTAEEVRLIEQAVLLHDKPDEVAHAGPSVRVVCDVDHLWSFTHENFWQDTVRKGVSPPAYLVNLEADLDAYFVSNPGRRMARALIVDRKAEVVAWRAWVREHGTAESGDD
jgi:hypothetical protein